MPTKEKLAGLALTERRKNRDSLRQEIVGLTLFKLQEVHEFFVCQIISERVKWVYLRVLYFGILVKVLADLW